MFWNLLIGACATIVFIVGLCLGSLLCKWLGLHFRDKHLEAANLEVESAPATQIRCPRCKWWTFGLGRGPWRCYCGCEMKPMKPIKSNGTDG